jgi:hypothetical protein
MDPRYSVSEIEIRDASDKTLEHWATDPNCSNRGECAQAIQARIGSRESTASAKVEMLLQNPFDPRSDVSADAKYIAGRIVKHLWILFVLLPIVAAILLAIIGAIK